MSKEKIQKQFGLWDSPISPISMARGLSFSDVAWDSDGTLVWREARSDRGVLVVQPPDGQAWRDLNADYSVRAGVGYGGGDFAVKQGHVFFVDAETGRLYRQFIHSGVAEAITPAFGKYAAPTPSPDGRYLLFVHTYERRDILGIVESNGENWPKKLVFGDDFYMQPCWHPHGDQIAWIAWNHPNMPWDGTRLYIATLDKTTPGLPEIGNKTLITGDENTSVFQPEFSPDGRYLAYISDASGWWHIYLYALESGQHTQITKGKAEHGNPAWVQGMRTYSFSPDGGEIYFIRNQDGFKNLWRLDLASGDQEKVPLGEEYTWLEQITVSADGRGVALIASGGSTPYRVISHGFENGTRIWRRSLPEDLPSGAYSLPQALTWRGMDDGLVHGILYAPSSEDFEGVGSPPLISLIHGGPTSQRGAHYDALAQFFTSRGYAVLQVNYRGSTGYGREYRDKLKTNWGIYDVEDAVSGSRHLVEQGLVEADKHVIMGGSAGGFTVLKALEDYSGYFKAGICLYGVANQFALVADTHKFEERYSESLLGPLPDSADRYRQRSPVFYADKIQDPIAIFQGEDDKVVPRSQSDEIVAALKRNSVPHEYHLYPGEGHGFRKTETIGAFYKAVEKFLRQYVIYA